MSGCLGFGSVNEGVNDERKESEWCWVIAVGCGSHVFIQRN